MDQNEETFEYRYSAKQQEEIEAIRRKYLPKEEDKMEQLRQLGQGRSTDYKQLAARRELLEEMLSYFKIYVGIK